MYYLHDCKTGKYRIYDGTKCVAIEETMEQVECVMWLIRISKSAD